MIRCSLLLSLAVAAVDQMVMTGRMDSLLHHHHCLWQVEFIHLPQEDYPHLGFFGEPSHLRSRLMVPKKLKDFTMSSGESCSMMRVGGAGLWASRSLQAMAGR